METVEYDITWNAFAFGEFAPGDFNVRFQLGDFIAARDGGGAGERYAAFAGRRHHKHIDERRRRKSDVVTEGREIAFDGVINGNSHTCHGEYTPFRL